MILAAQRHHDLGLLPGTMRLIEQAMLLRRFPIGARLRELVAIIAALLPDAWRRLRGRVPAQDIPEQAVQQQASATQIELAQASPDKASALMSLAQLTVHHMKLEGKLHKLTGDGELDDQDLEFEWQHRLKTTPNWQKSTDHMPDHQKQHFFSTERRFFVEGIHNAFARAQAKLEAQAKLDAEASLEAEAKPEPDQLGELAAALAKFQHDRLQELDGFSPELTQDLTQELPQLPKTFVQQALTPKEYEALALAMFQHNRLHRDSPNAVKAISYQVLSKEKYEALALAMVGKELDYQQMRNQLRHKEQRRRQNEKKRRKRKELKARGKNFDAQKSEKARRALEEEWRCEAREIEEQARAKRLSQEEQRRKECEEREVEKQAKADRLLQEELAQQRTKAKKQRKQRALKKKNAALDDASASSVWQAVKSFGNYSECGV